MISWFLSKFAFTFELPRYVSAWMKDVYALPGVADTVDVAGYRASYFGQLFPLNPGGIIPAGPTEKDLGLVRTAADAGRGGVSPAEVFHFR